VPHVTRYDRSIEASGQVPVQAVRKASPTDVPGLARMMAQAFYNDPPTKWVFRDDARRMERLERGFALGLRKLWLPNNEAYTTEDLSGGAFWDPPGEWKLGIGKQLRLLPSMVGVYGRDLPRLLRLLSIYEAKHPDEPVHFYLPFLGVVPDAQGKGIGTALLKAMLDRCDREGLPAYLEATTPGSRAGYERVSFAVTGEFTLPDGPPIWQMWREAQR
jgi:GNAT superfamily N-acetyltransferase